MKRILLSGVITGLLLLAASLSAVAAPALQGSEDPGPTLYLTLAIIGVVVVALVGRFVLARPTRPAPLAAGEHRNYGPAGGAVCQSCGLPFARNFLDLNLLAGKLTRCPHCGKLAIRPAATPDQLYAAEERERQAAGGAAATTATPSPLSAEERLWRTIEDSRYE